MEKIFGANWKTSLSGLIVVAAGVIYSNAGLIAFLPDSWEPAIKGVAGLIAAISAAWFVLQAKDKNVTGGTIQQTADGCVASSHAHTESSAVNETQQARAKP